MIYFNEPSIEGRELEYVREAVFGGRTASGGPFSERVVEFLSDALSGSDVLLTTSCTGALEMAAMLLDLGPDDVVVVPSFTFVTTALAFAREGARLRFADVEPSTLTMDPDCLEDLMDERVRAVVPVHYGGVAGRFDRILDMAAGEGIDVIEDTAHGLFASSAEGPLGSAGRFGTLSFHETKNFNCGEGGALIVNRESDRDRAHVLLDKGTDRRAFFLGQVDKYRWVDTGSSFGMADILAAYLLGQLEERDRILALRRAVWEAYDRELRPRAGALGLRVPTIPPGQVQGYHLYYVLLPDRPTRDAALAYLGERGIRATFHYVPLHSSPAGRRFSDGPSHCPVTDDVSARILRLPFYNRLSTAAVSEIAGTLVEFLSRG